MGYFVHTPTLLRLSIKLNLESECVVNIHLARITIRVFGRPRLG